MSEIEIKISQLRDSPWRFKVISSKDFENLVNAIETYGSHATNPILIAKIDGKYYIVDGHARRDAISEAGFNKAKCVIAKWIRNFSDLRVWSFKLNRHGHYNPLELLRMVKEDIKTVGNMEKVAKDYGVTEEYMHNLLKLDALDDSAKGIIDKVINVARKRYQFVLEQINTYHLSNIAELEPKQQVEILEWLFHDIIYGPPNESLVSLPSIYEVIAEIEKHKSNRIIEPAKISNKKKTRHAIGIADHLEFRCSCGNRFYVDLTTGEVSEYIEKDNLIIKKKVEAVHSFPSNHNQETQLQGTRSKKSKVLMLNE